MAYRNERDISGNVMTTSGSFAVTNFTKDLALDCNEVQLSGSVGVTADVLGTLIAQLSELGIINATVAA